MLSLLLPLLSRLIGHLVGARIVLFFTQYLLMCVSTFGYLLTSDNNQYNISGMSAAESVGVAVGSLFPSSVELMIYCMLLAVHWLL